MEAELTYLQNSIKIIDFRHYAEDAAMGNPYNTLFYISVVSGGFSGCGSWECDIKQLKELCEEMRQMYDFKRKSAVLDDYLYGSKLEFSLEKSGHLTVSGTIYGNCAEQSLSFCFGADQTAIPTFVKGLERLIASA